MYKILKMPNGTYWGVSFTPLHRRYRGGIYRHATDWLAQGGATIAWGRTRREAFARLIEMTGGKLIEKQVRPGIRSSGGAKIIPFDGRQ